MATYQKPVALATTGVAEGVFAASGAVDESDCSIEVWVNGWRQNSYTKKYILQIGFSHSDHSHLVKDTVLHLTLDRAATFEPSDFFGYAAIGGYENTTDFQIQMTGGGIYNKVGDYTFVCDSQPNVLNIYATHN